MEVVALEMTKMLSGNVTVYLVRLFSASALPVGILLLGSSNRHLADGFVLFFSSVNLFVLAFATPLTHLNLKVVEVRRWKLPIFNLLILLCSFVLSFFYDIIFLAAAMLAIFSLFIEIFVKSYGKLIFLFTVTFASTVVGISIAFFVQNVYVSVAGIFALRIFFNCLGLMVFGKNIFKLMRISWLFFDAKSYYSILLPILMNSLPYLNLSLGPLYLQRVAASAINVVAMLGNTYFLLNLRTKFTVAGTSDLALYVLAITSATIFVLDSNFGFFLASFYLSLSVAKNSAISFSTLDKFPNYVVNFLFIIILTSATQLYLLSEISKTLVVLYLLLPPFVWRYMKV